MSEESDTTNNCSTALAVTIGGGTTTTTTTAPATTTATTAASTTTTTAATSAPTTTTTTTTTVAGAPAVDLVVRALSLGGASPTAGEWFTLEATVHNQGDERSGTTWLRYYRSADSTVTTGDTEVGADYVSRLSASAEGDESVRLRAPSAAGTYYYGACVDAVSGESDTTNNCSPALAVAVAAKPVPDLVVGSLSLSGAAPAAGRWFTLEATVRNQGDGRSSSSRLRYYRSADSTVTSADTEVGTDYVFSLAASADGDESLRLRAPSAAGTYYYGACVDAVSDESDTTNNCSTALAVTIGGGATTTTTTVPGATTTTPATATATTTTTTTTTVGGAPAPDLVVRAPALSGGAPTAGDWFTLEATVHNRGDERSDSTRLRYYRSADSRVTSADAEVGTDYVFRLSASADGDESVRLRAPSAPGTYYYGACVDAVSGESDISNNCSTALAVVVAAKPVPDLVVRTPTVSGAAPAAGEWFTLEATVHNRGGGRSDSSWLRYYRSADSSVTSADTEVGTDYVFRLAGSADGDEWVRLRAPSVAGTYYYGACVDAVPDESDTTNNCSTALAVTVGGSATTTATTVPVTTTTVGGAPTPGSGGQASRCVTGGAVSAADAASSPGLVADCEVLLAVRDTLAGTATLNWSAATPIAQWDGVVVSAANSSTPSRVIVLYLGRYLGGEHKVSGRIPAELGRLTSLEILYLYGSELSGGIPAELGRLTNLVTLDLSSNGLSGGIPAELGKLTRLKYLYLHHNRLSGRIPAELGELHVYELSLSNNGLSGPVPAELGELWTLDRLNLSDNGLSGPIPAELGKLYVEYLDLRNNRLSGRIPAELGDMERLERLYLSDNRLSGPVPAELGEMERLERLWLSRNEKVCIPQALRDKLRDKQDFLLFPRDLRVCDDTIETGNFNLFPQTPGTPNWGNWGGFTFG